MSESWTLTCAAALPEGIVGNEERVKREKSNKLIRLKGPQQSEEIQVKMKSHKHVGQRGSNKSAYTEIRMRGISCGRGGEKEEWKEREDSTPST